MIRGSIVALVTPMNEKGEIDFAEIDALVDFHIEAGTDGIVAVGTTGESATLPVQEHVEVVKAVIKRANKRIKVIAGNGANSTAEAIELTKSMAGLGLDAFLCVAPYYNKPSQKGMELHFKAIADVSDVPQILYNVPGRCAVDLLPETVAILSKHENIIGIKEATGDIERLKEIKPLVADDFILLSGDDCTVYDFMKQGGHGVISVTANVAPDKMAQLCQAAMQGDWDKAESIDVALQGVHDSMFIESNPVPVKWALHRMGMLKYSSFRLPLISPELNSQKAIEQALQQAKLI